MKYDIRRITEDYYNKKREEYRTKQQELQGKMAKLTNADEDYYIAADYLLQLSNRAYELFQSSEVHEKRQLLKLILQNLRLKGSLVDYDLIKPFDKILFYASRQDWLENRNSNITTQLACIFKTFEDFRFVQQIREEIERVKPSIALVTS